MIAIVAVDSEWGIGLDGNIPWHLPGDFAFFKNKTMGHIVVMGRKTFESLPSGALSGRENIVMTRNHDYAPEGASCVRSVEELMEALEGISERKEIFVIGGAEIYEMLLPFTDRCFVTKVDTVAGADSFFPNIDAMKRFEIVSESECVRESGLDYRFLEYKIK